jgi:hypothetical protein
LFLSSGNKAPAPHSPHVHDNTKRPNQRPRPLPNTPMPASPTWKSLKSASMSRQRRWMALAPPTMLPGHGSAFLQLPRRRHASLSSPYDATRPPPHLRRRKCQNTRVVKHHPRISSPSRHPSDVALPGTNKYDPKPTHATKIRHKNAKTPPASSECASALPGDVSDDRARICA